MRPLPQEVQQQQGNKYTYQVTYQTCAGIQLTTIKKEGWLALPKVQI